MAQFTITDGDTPTAAQLNTYAFGEGGAWTSWTPTVTQSGSVTVTNTRSRYARYGRTIHFSTILTVTGSGSAGVVIEVSLPATAASTGEHVGPATVFDTSATTRYPALAFLASTTSLRMVPSSATGTGGLGDTVFTAALGAGDTISISGTYEAAS